MFKSKKCPRCEEKVGKKFDFCASCGLDLRGRDNGNNRDYGFLGKNDFEDMGIKMPFGFNTIFKSLTKELGKQMFELEREMREESKRGSKDVKEGKPRVRTNSFSIHIGGPGIKSMRIDSGDLNGMKLNQVSKEVGLKLPKISDNDLKKIKDLKRREAETDVRRLSDRVIYEIAVPNVKSIGNVDISKLEKAFEIKAFSDKEVFVKNLDVTLPLINYFLKEEKLVLEFGLK